MSLVVQERQMFSYAHRLKTDFSFQSVANPIFNTPLFTLSQSVKAL